MTAPQVVITPGQPSYQEGAAVEVTVTVTGQNTVTSSEPVDLSGPDARGGTEEIRGTETLTDPDPLTASLSDSLGTPWVQQSASQSGQVLTAVFTGTAQPAAQPLTATGTDEETGETGAATLALTVTQPAPAVLTGATVTPNSYPAGTTPVQAIQGWAQVTGAMPQAGKIYVTNYPTAMYDLLDAYKTLGVVPVVCFDKMNPDGSDAAALKASCEFLGANFPAGYLVFIQEPQAHGPKITAANFGAVHKAYYPVAKAVLPDWPVYYDASGPAGVVALQEYYPRGFCDGVAVDMYCNYGPWDKQLAVLDAAAALADGDNLPGGVAWLEMGVSASSGLPPQAQMTGYLTGAAEFVIARRKAGKKCGPFLWWNGFSTVAADSPGENSLAPANPVNGWIVPLWKAFIAAVAAAG